MTGPPEVVIGLDVGTSSVKALAVTRSGATFGPVRVATPTTRHPDGRVEHDPTALWDAVTGCLAGLASSLPGHLRVVAVATATVGEAVVPVDETGRELRPVIAWHDQRGAPYLTRWRREPGIRAVYEITGQTADERASANKILWVGDHEAAVAARTALWLGMDAWVSLRLCGVAATAPSLAARTMLFDRHTLRWSEPLVALVGVGLDALPATVPGGTVVGPLTDDAARRTGLPAGIPVVAGGHDHLCAAFAARGGTGTLVDSVGSAESLVGVADGPLAGDPGWDAHVNCYPDVEWGCYALSAQVGVTGVALDWLAREVYGLEPGPDATRSMFGELPGPLRPGGVVFFPQFGRGTAPRWDPSAALGAFLGLTPAHRRRDLLQAVLEAACCSLRHNVEWMADHGADVELVRVEGGPVGSEAWSQLKADVLNRPIAVVERPDSTALGAALLAAVGAGWYRDPAVAAAANPLPIGTWMPSPESASQYERLYSEVFLQLPDAVTAVHRALKGIVGTGRRPL
jgi:sugar (pentulose or hexulose) kinase